MRRGKRVADRSRHSTKLIRFSLLLLLPFDSLPRDQDPTVRLRVPHCAFPVPRGNGRRPCPFRCGGGTPTRRRNASFKYLPRDDHGGGHGRGSLLSPPLAAPPPPRRGRRPLRQPPVRAADAAPPPRRAREESRDDGLASPDRCSPNIVLPHRCHQHPGRCLLRRRLCRCQQWRRLRRHAQSSRF